MADIFYATLELKNIRMEGLLFSFLEKYDKTRYSATEFGRNKPMNFRPSGTLNVNANLIDLTTLARRLNIYKPHGFF